MDISRNNCRFNSFAKERRAISTMIVLTFWRPYFLLVIIQIYYDLMKLSRIFHHLEDQSKKETQSGKRQITWRARILEKGARKKVVPDAEMHELFPEH